MVFFPQYYWLEHATRRRTQRLRPSAARRRTPRSQSRGLNLINHIFFKEIRFSMVQNVLAFWTQRLNLDGFPTDGRFRGREERQVPLPLRLRQGRPRLQGCQGRPLQVILQKNFFVCSIHKILEFYQRIIKPWWSTTDRPLNYIMTQPRLI